MSVAPPTITSAMSPTTGPAPTALDPMSKTFELEIDVVFVVPVVLLAEPLMNPLHVEETLAAVISTKAVRDQFPLD